ncbi:unnamed protein product [Cyprideis torosa]|uniref:Uncharacterized protein n=1 Tax=Cyprideis torosa TaxID=163714 RepID=A0A7R8ZWC0_9CRUS|nr:unnamed protein product [Cyprideis torosa]CAG0911551.1 unnamed protein product [Cyprideis torosa]
MPLEINSSISIPDNELDWTGIRAQGAGGQNVNKVSSALHLRFDIHASSLPQAVKDKLLNCSDSRITREGVVVIKAQRFRTQEKNRLDGLERLRELVLAATIVPKARRATKPSKAAKQRRMDEKSRRGQHKTLRGKIDPSGD